MKTNEKNNQKNNAQKVNEKELLKPHPEYNLILMVKLIERGQRRIANWQKKIDDEQKNIEKMKAKIVEHFSKKDAQ